MKLIGKWFYIIIKWYCYAMLLLSIIIGSWELYLLEIVNITGVERAEHMHSVHNAGWAFVTFLILSVILTLAPVTIKNKNDIIQWLKNN